MSKKLVIFDIDGTLLDSNKLGSIAFAKTFERLYQVKFPTIDWTKYSHVVDDTIFKEVFLQTQGKYPTLNEMDQYKTEVVKDLRASIKNNIGGYREVKGAVALIEHLLDDDEYELGIATGGWKAPATTKMAHIDVPYSSMSCSYADYKVTRAEIIEGAMSGINMDEISKTIYIGDAVWDVSTTKDMGMPFIGMRIKGDVDFLENLGAKHVMSDYLDRDLFLQYLEEAVPPK